MIITSGLAFSRRLPLFPALVAAAVLLGCSSLAAEDATAYEPKRGQAGKDVVWIPTPDELVTRMLRLAQVTSKDFIVDLGAGDDRIENYDRIEGDVFLGLGNDSFLQRASAALIGTVDAGVEFSWQSPIQPDRYRVTIRRGSDRVWQTETTAFRAAPPAGVLETGVEYSWQVEAIDREGDVRMTSPPRTFTIR